MCFSSASAKTNFLSFLRFKLLSLRKFFGLSERTFFQEAHACVRGTWCVFREHGVCSERMRPAGRLFLY